MVEGGWATINRGVTGEKCLIWDWGPSLVEVNKVLNIN